MKRILSLILSLVLTLSLLPAQALAEEAEEIPAATVEATSKPTEPETSSEPTSTEDSSQPELTVTVTAEDNLTELAVGDRLPLTARVSPETEDAVVVWASSDEAVATVDQNGLVTGVAPGSVTITARVGDAQGSYDLTVTRPQSGFLSDTDVILSGSCGAQGDNLTFTLTQDGVLTITGAGDMVISSYSSHSPWYDNRSQITSVVLEKGVTSIGEWAFNDCSSLTSISIPDSVTSIGNDAFCLCSSLTSISIPDGVTSIGECAFWSCTSLTSISIPEGVTSIGPGAFSGCSSLTSISIPEGVTSIGDGAFWSCTSLESFTIPESVTSIGEWAFCECSSLTSISIPAGVTSIGDGAFYECSSLTSISLPDSITSIGNDAFCLCSSLTSISIPDSLTSIGDNAFEYCSSLTSISIPEGVTSIEDYTFCECSSLTSISIPAGVTSIGDGAFYECSSLTSVSIPEGVTSIGNDAFCLCSSLTSISIPEGVTSIGDGAFWGCTSLTSVSIPEGVTSIEDYTFGDCSSLTSISIPAGVTSIGEETFYECSKLTRIYFLGDGFLASGDICNNDVTAYYPHGNTTWTQEIRDSFGEYFTWVEACIEHTVVIDPAKEATCTETGLTEGSHCSVCQQILVPQEVIPMAHRFVDHVCQFCGMCGGTYGENLTWTLTEGRLVISGAGDMISLSEGEAPWYDLRDQITTLELLPGVTSVGDYAFAGCTNLTQVILPEGLTVIGSHAFRDCAALEELRFPTSVAVIGSQILTGSGVTELSFYGDMPQIAEDAFTGINVSVAYPENNPTWGAMGDYGGTTQWTPGTARAFTLELRQNYLALSPGESARLTLRTDIPLSAEAYTWAVEQEEVVVSVDGQGIVTALAQGSAYVTVSTQIDGITYSARCRVDVTGEPVAQELRGVQLGTSAVTAELYRTDYASFDVILLLEQNAGFTSVDQAPQDSGMAIESARFADAAMDQLFHLAVKDDRTLLVVPTEDAIQNPTLVKSSYTGKVTVTIDGQDFTTDTALKLTVKKSTPKLKATALTFNAFYTRQSQPIVITGATVTGITAGAAIPDWLILEDGALTLSPDAPAKAGSGTVKLLVDTQEWAIPASVSLSVKRTYTAPALKLSATTVTIPTYTNPDDSGFLGGEVAVRLLCKNKKDTLEGLNVSWIEVPQGWLQLSGENLYQNDGWFPVRPNQGVTPAAGKIVLKVHFSDTDRVVELPLTIKTQQTPLVVRTVLTEKKISLNTSIQDGFFVPWNITPQDMDLSRYNLSWDIRDSNGNSVKDMFEIWDGKPLGIMTKKDTQPGTYALYLDLVDKQTGQIKTEESTVVKFTVLPPTAKPGVSAKALDVIDFSFPDPRTRISLSFKNFFVNRVLGVQYTVLNGDKTDVTDQFTMEYDQSICTWVLIPNGEVPDGTYTLKLGLQINLWDPTVNTTECTTKITVKRTPIKLKLSKTSLSLNAAIGDRATVDVTCLTKDYTLDQPVISLMDSTGKVSAEGRLDVSYADGKLTVATNNKTLYGATYKVLLRATEKDAPVTLTVKIPSLYQSTVSATLKAKGTIDVIRDGTSVTLTPTYKNYAGEAAVEKELKIYASSDKKNYTQDCTALFEITPNADGTYTIAKVPGVYLDTTLKYRVVLSFPSYADSKEAYVSLSVKSGAAKLTVTGTPLLYRSDRLSRGTFTITAKDTTLNPIAQVEFKDAKQAALFDLYDYGNGQYAIGFKDGVVQSGKYPTSVTLNVKLTGNGSAKPNATVTVKLKIQ